MIPHKDDIASKNEERRGARVHVSYRVTITILKVAIELLNAFCAITLFIGHENI
jgi:hypothetical protein